MSDAGEIYWAAGFWDGEGCASADSGTQFSLYVNQTEPSPLHRFHAAVGGIGSVNGPIMSVTGNQRPYYRWNAHGRSARVVAAKLFPLVCAPKRDQFVRVSATVAGVTEAQLVFDLDDQD